MYKITRNSHPKIIKIFLDFISVIAQNEGISRKAV